MNRLILLFVLLSLVVKAQTIRELIWNFPLPRTHTGILLGNGTQGLMVWGQGRELNITVGRAGFWDHRGGNEFSARTTYPDVKRLLETKDEVALRKVFEVPRKSDNQPSHPQQLGGGVLKLTLPEGYTLQQGVLQLATAEIQITVTSPKGNKELLRIGQDPFRELAWVVYPKTCAGKIKTELRAAWDNPAVKSALEKTSVQPPTYWQEASVSGFTQTLPEDEPLSVMIATQAEHVVIGTTLGGELSSVKKQMASFQPPFEARNKWWKNYWAEVPRIALPDPVLQEIADYGLYKQACATPPQGKACALQGPFMEEYQLPPWSNDYHFNINVQMIYTPALATNRATHLQPLWDLMNAWIPQMKANGEQFFGRPGALMLPHAVDDRCRVVGTFWTGTIDHACTAWMAYLAWQHFAYTMDDQVLRNTAWPLLTGAFEGYWAMLEEVDNGSGGKRFSLPVSVSPEFRGDQMTAWGRDASFQLAALHKVAQVLPKAATRLGLPLDPRWQQVSDRLPPYTTVEGSWIDEWPTAKNKRIALWDGQDLIESHRHHSHLGSIYPFVSIDPQAENHRTIVQGSINRWVNRGMGMWSGWCVPWASILQTRTGNTEAAVSLLHYWNENFVNEGRGTLHNSNKPGISILANPVYNKLPEGAPKNEIMQLDGGFGALSAVLELLVQNRLDGIYVLPNLPDGWKELSFDRIRTEGAFQISSRVVAGQVEEVKVRSLAGGRLRLVPNLGARFQVNGVAMDGPRFEEDCVAGQEMTLTRMR
jgi:alpha-L-fucosidase 2